MPRRKTRTVERAGIVFEGNPRSGYIARDRSRSSVCDQHPDSGCVCPDAVFIGKVEQRNDGWQWEAWWPDEAASYPPGSLTGRDAHFERAADQLTDAWHTSDWRRLRTRPSS